MKSRNLPIVLLAIGVSTLAACLGTRAVPVDHSVAPRKDYAVQLVKLSEPVNGTPGMLPSAINGPQDAFNPSRVSSSADAALDSAISATRARLEVAAHNLANAHTIGFKRSRVLFEDAGYRTDTIPGSSEESSTGIVVGTGAKVLGTQLDMSEGTLRSTGRPFDLAIEGCGFFQMNDPSGKICYSRSGTFAVNNNGQLCHVSAGVSRLVEPQINVPQDTTSVMIGSNGLVRVQRDGEVSMSNVGQFQVAIFLNAEGLKQIGECLFAGTEASGPPIIGNPGSNAAGVIRQKTVELSNVDIDAECAAYREAQAFLAMLQSLRSEAVATAKQ